MASSVASSETPHGPEARSVPSSLGSELSTNAFWHRSSDERAPVFARLRAEAPVTFQPPPDFGMLPSTHGYWAVTGYDDVVKVSRNPETFCSGLGVTFDEVPLEMLEEASSFLAMDAPRHTALRRVVSRAFTPRRVAELDAAITAKAAQIVQDFTSSGGGDAVEDFAMHLPLWTMGMMMGVPESMQQELYRCAGLMTACLDSENLPAGSDPIAMQFEAALTLTALAMELAAARRAKPGDDLISALANADLDEDVLSDKQIGGIFLLFAVAGNDTTRNTTSHGLRLLAEHPDEWRAAVEAPETVIEPLVEEIARVASPVIQFRRTATCDTRIGDQEVAEGDHVVVFYESANRDEAVFDRPEVFDVRRTPNHHVAFGGGGPHFCLGANLARAQLRALFRSLASAGVTIEAGPPVRFASNFIHGITSMPVTLHPIR